jgi:hypothetical protein
MNLYPSFARVGFLAAGLGWLMVGACGGDGAKTFGGDPGPDTGGTHGSAGGAGGQVVSGSGGHNGTGGLGSGGASSSGGRGGGGGGSGGGAGTGGGIGTGGGGGFTSGTGGRTGGIGGAGATGSGGAGGSGGRSAVGGTSGGGAPGTGGSTSTICDDLVAAYDKEIPIAKMCSTITRGACAAKVPQTLGCSSCATYVDDATRLDKLDAEWTSDGCVRKLCPRILCLAVTGATCTPSTAQSLNGSCSDTTGLISAQ